MKSIPLFVQASSLCMRNGESVRRRMSRLGAGGRGMAALNSAGNQLVKLNIKKNRKDCVRQSDLSAISDQSHNSHTSTHKHIHA